MKQRNYAVALLAAVLALTACQSDDGAGDAALTQSSEAPAKPTPGTAADAQASPGKPSAPIDIDYNVVGTAIVGQPVSINLDVSSTVSDRPVVLEYSVVDAGSLAFPESQLREVSLGRLRELQPASQQVTVIPQREGRLYLNVTAEIQTEGGTVIKAMAIPIQVGDAAPEREVNGEIKEDAEGDAIVSMPADDQ